MCAAITISRNAEMILLGCNQENRFRIGWSRGGLCSGSVAERSKALV